MRLLDTEQLEYAFRLHDIGHEELARAFYSDLWDLIQQSEKASDGAELSDCGRQLRLLCRDYFAAMRRWYLYEKEGREGADTCRASRDNAREAFAILDPYERQFQRYALCYLELNRALIRTRTKIAHYTHGHTPDAQSMQGVNHGTGPVIMRAHDERGLLSQKRQRLERMRSILSALDPLMESLSALLPEFFGHEIGDRQVTRFKGALRQARLQDAVAMADQWPTEELRHAGRHAVKVVQENLQELRLREGILLHTDELGLVEASLKEEEARADAFLEKFNVPYMVFQYRGLLHLGYVLGRIGSLEGLIIQHAKLLALAARAHNEPARAKLQEEAILGPARLLLRGKFRTLGTIFDAMETTLEILEKLFASTWAYDAARPK